MTSGYGCGGDGRRWVVVFVEVRLGTENVGRSGGRESFNFHRNKKEYLHTLIILRVIEDGKTQNKRILIIHNKKYLTRNRSEAGSCNKKVCRNIIFETIVLVVLSLVCEDDVYALLGMAYLLQANHIDYYRQILCVVASVVIT